MSPRSTSTRLWPVYWQVAQCEGTALADSLSSGLVWACMPDSWFLQDTLSQQFILDHFVVAHNVFRCQFGEDEDIWQIGLHAGEENLRLFFCLFSFKVSFV